MSNYLEQAFNISKEKTTENILLPIREKPDSSLTSEERKEKIAIVYLDSLYRLRSENKKQIIPQTVSFVEKPEIPTPDINTPPFQHKSIITPVEKNMLQFIKAHSAELPISADSNYLPKFPGKIIAWQQTFNYLKQNPSKIITEWVLEIFRPN